MKAKKKRRSGIWIELIIIIGIMICKMFIMNYNETKRMNGYLSMYDDGSIVVVHKEEMAKKFKEMGRPIIEFYPDSCRMIEVFDEDFNITTRMLFTDVSQYYHGIDEHPDSKAIFLSKNEGTINLKTDEDIGIYFKWVDLPDGERYLLTFCYSRSNLREFSMFNVACYTSIFLTFLLFLMLLIRQYNTTIRHYDALTKEVRSKMVQ